MLVDPKRSTIYHIELRSSDNGNFVLVNDTDRRDVTDPKKWSVQTGVYDYGGEPAVVFDGIVYFSNFSDGKVYRVQDGSGLEPELIAPTDDGRSLSQLC